MPLESLISDGGEGSDREDDSARWSTPAQLESVDEPASVPDDDEPTADATAHPKGGVGDAAAVETSRRLGLPTAVT
jgi:hypothetical protein